MAPGNVVWQQGQVSREERPSRGGTIWFTGFSGSGKSTIASAVEAALIAAGRPAYLLDGDNVRHGLNGDLGFSAEDRTENVRRISHVAQLMADAGLVVLVPVISPYRDGRQWARDIHAAADLPFVEVFVDAPIEACMERDVKGLYAKAAAGEIPNFTGVSDPYEPPENPEIHIRTDEETPETSVASVLLYLDTNGWM
ncbi:MAG TPA: adenylyl-sulfate kinase [Actinomycetota bacterium]|jgi:adenylyl-sulfate kinase|nr:adenylyl-sulfate kinase [Actinomycetota bacterium]